MSTFAIIEDMTKSAKKFKQGTEISCFPYPVSLYLYTDAVEFDNDVFEHTDISLCSDPDIGYSFSHVEDGALSVYVKADLSLLLHELVHASLSIFRHCSIEIEDGGEEAFCYFLSSLYERCREAYVA